MGCSWSSNIDVERLRPEDVTGAEVGANTLPFHHRGYIILGCFFFVVVFKLSQLSINVVYLTRIIIIIKTL